MFDRSQLWSQLASTKMTILQILFDPGEYRQIYKWTPNLFTKDQKWKTNTCWVKLRNIIYMILSNIIINWYYLHGIKNTITSFSILISLQSLYFLLCEYRCIPGNYCASGIPLKNLFEVCSQHIIITWNAFLINPSTLPDGKRANSCKVESEMNWIMWCSDFSKQVI